MTPRAARPVKAAVGLALLACSIIAFRPTWLWRLKPEPELCPSNLLGDFALFSAVEEDLGTTLVMGSCHESIQPLFQGRHVEKVVYASRAPEAIKPDTIAIVSPGEVATSLLFDAVERLNPGGILLLYTPLPEDETLQFYLGSLDILFQHNINRYTTPVVAIAARKTKVPSPPTNVSIEGISTAGPADKRYFLTWTTDKRSWEQSPLRWLVVKKLLSTVSDAELFVFANKLPVNFFKGYRRVHLVRYDEHSFFTGTPLEAWARVEKWKIV